MTCLRRPGDVGRATASGGHSLFQNHLLNGEPQALVDMLGLLGEGSDLDDDDMPSVSCTRVRAAPWVPCGLALAEV